MRAFCNAHKAHNRKLCGKVQHSCSCSDHGQGLLHQLLFSQIICVWIQEESPVLDKAHYPDFQPLCFDNPHQAFQAKSTSQLARSLAVFKACGIKPFVQNADWLLNSSKQLFGASLVNGVVKRTFFKHFCAGELFKAALAAYHRGRGLTALSGLERRCFPLLFSSAKLGSLCWSILYQSHLMLSSAGCLPFAQQDAGLQAYGCLWPTYCPAINLKG